VGAGASVYSAVKVRNIRVYSKECLFCKIIRLSDEGKLCLSREDKEKIVAENIKCRELCPEE